MIVYVTYVSVNKSDLDTGELLQSDRERDTSETAPEDDCIDFREFQFEAVVLEEGS